MRRRKWKRFFPLFSNSEKKENQLYLMVAIEDTCCLDLTSIHCHDCFRVLVKIILQHLILFELSTLSSSRFKSRLETDTSNSRNEEKWKTMKQEGNDSLHWEFISFPFLHNLYALSHKHALAKQCFHWMER